jgi:hypothetical protein
MGCILGDFFTNASGHPGQEAFALFGGKAGFSGSELFPQKGKQRMSCKHMHM